ncbi:MAG: helix-turn-helix transcriptional regulator [bacterium]
MKNVCSRPLAPAGLPALQLQAIWSVDEGPSYDVQRPGGGTGGLIAIRTWKGAGRVLLAGGATLELAAGSVVVLEHRQIVRYHCAGARWTFAWFEFTVAGARPFPAGVVLQVARRAAEEGECRAAFVLLRRQTAAQRALATALFAALLLRWMEKAPGVAPQTRHGKAVGRIIDAMPDRIGSSWRVHEMARAAGMSERAFRIAFRQMTGCPPKAFYDRARLAFAEDLLRLGTYNVSEVAVRLGFSSPFHFSKAFKQQHGLPPARLLG